MKNYGIQSGSTRPPEIEMTDNSVFIASDIVPFEEEIDGHTLTGYHYNYTEYTKNEYILKLHQDVIDTQVALCELYETIGGE
jgi:hypothetical protein